MCYVQKLMASILTIINRVNNIHPIASSLRFRLRQGRRRLKSIVWVAGPNSILLLG